MVVMSFSYYWKNKNKNTPIITEKPQSSSAFPLKTSFALSPDDGIQTMEQKGKFQSSKALIQIDFSLQDFFKTKEIKQAGFTLLWERYQNIGRRLWNR